MDPLSDALHLARFTGAVFLEARFTAPWSVFTRAAPRAPAGKRETEYLVKYHLITEGACVATLPGEEPVWLEAGDLILFPHGDRHELASAIGIPPVSTEELIDPPTSEMLRLEYGGGGAVTRMLCGFLTCDRNVCKPLLSALPYMMRLKAGRGPVTAWFESAVQYTLDGSISPQAGGNVVVAKMAEVLFAEAVRCYVETLPEDQRGWMAALRDRHISRALALMHEQPAYPWTVEELGRQVAMSRSSLAMRFTQVLGQTPMAYLASLRMQLAARMLVADARPIVRIAEETGYESESSFNRAFKRSFDVPPATFRRERQRLRMPHAALPAHAIA